MKSNKLYKLVLIKRSVSKTFRNAHRYLNSCVSGSFRLSRYSITLDIQTFTSTCCQNCFYLTFINPISLIVYNILRFRFYSNSNSLETQYLPKNKYFAQMQNNISTNNVPINTCNALNNIQISTNLYK